MGVSNSNLNVTSLEELEEKLNEEIEAAQNEVNESITVDSSEPTNDSEDEDYASLLAYYHLVGKIETNLKIIKMIDLKIKLLERDISLERDSGFKRKMDDEIKALVEKKRNLIRSTEIPN